MSAPTWIFATSTADAATTRRFGFSGELPSPKVLKGLQERAATMLHAEPARVELSFVTPGDGAGGAEVKRPVRTYAQFVDACAAAVRGSTKDAKGRQVRSRRSGGLCADVADHSRRVQDPLGRGGRCAAQ